MRSGFQTLLVMMALGASGALAAPKPNGRAAIAEAVAKEIADDSQTISNKKVLAAVRPVGIDQDQWPDYAVNWEKFTFASWCGTGGCRYQLWRGSETGLPAPVFDRQVREVKMRKLAGETVFDFDFHGSVCGGYGVEVCPASFAWDARQQRMVERVARNGDGTIRYVSPFDGIDDDMPDTVADRIAARKAECKAQGGRTGDEDGEENFLFSSNSVPDVDGDGARDWALLGNTCTFADDRDSIDLPDELWVTAGHADQLVLALSAPMFKISVSTVPASVRTIATSEDCDAYSTDKEAKICPAQPMRWVAASRSFVAQ